ncbi:MAG: cache domain-containing protein [Deltaproteobacteria bacterium]|nr:cache domain-containing protein [Deltaproteobacteria bacterium]
MRINLASSAEYLKIVVPAVTAVILFVVAVFGYFLPAYRESLMNGKKEMIQELVHTAWNIVAGFEQQERSGVMSRERAQHTALEQIRTLRYGTENKDYFWINDMRPYMIMHPYRSDLEGHDISDFSDSQGVLLFKNFVETVRQQNEGYVSYMWQGKDNPDHIVPKLSFVKGFAPWDWIIGTGIYLEDVEQEIALLTRRLLEVSLTILALVSLLSGLLVLQAVRAAGLRRKAENELREYQNQLENLVAERTANLKQTNDSLRSALADIKTLRGIVPICSFCKKIRDDKGYWNQLEKFVSEHSTAEFSHSICPKCLEERYPDTEETH